MSSNESNSSSDEDEDKPIPDKVPKEIKSLDSDDRSYLNFKNLGDECIYLFWVNFDGEIISYGKIDPMNRCDDGMIMHSFVTHPWFAISKQKNRFLLNDKVYFLPPKHETWHHKEYGWLNQKWILEVPEESSDNSSKSDDDDDDDDNCPLPEDDNDSRGTENNQAESNSHENVEVAEAQEDGDIIYDFQYLNDSDDENSDNGDEIDDLVDDFDQLAFNQPLVNITNRDRLESNEYFEVLILPEGCMSLRKQCLIKCCALFPTLKDINSLDISSVFKIDILSARKKYFSIISPSGELTN